MYFDSTGAKMPHEVGILMKRLEKQFKEMGINVRVMSNEGFKHQKSSTECGIRNILHTGTRYGREITRLL